MTKDKRPALVLRFLARIAVHNDREWMAAHRAEYDEARAAFEDLTADLIRALAEVDPAVAPLTVRDCTYRIYRDTRFSPDKSPYKRHMGAYVNPRGKKSPHGGYYLHLQPGACEIAGGAYCLEPKLLRAVRESSAPSSRRAASAPSSPSSGSTGSRPCPRASPAISLGPTTSAARTTAWAMPSVTLSSTIPPGWTGRSTSSA